MIPPVILPFSPHSVGAFLSLDFSAMMANVSLILFFCFPLTHMLQLLGVSPLGAGLKSWEELV